MPQTELSCQITKTFCQSLICLMLSGICCDVLLLASARPPDDSAGSQFLCSPEDSFEKIFLELGANSLHHQAFNILKQKASEADTCSAASFKAKITVIRNELARIAKRKIGAVASNTRYIVVGLKYFKELNTRSNTAVTEWTARAFNYALLGLCRRFGYPVCVSRIQFNSFLLRLPDARPKGAELSLADRDIIGTIRTFLRIELERLIKTYFPKRFGQVTGDQVFEVLFPKGESKRTVRLGVGRSLQEAHIISRGLDPADTVDIDAFRFISGVFTHVRQRVSQIPSKELFYPLFRAKNASIYIDRPFYRAYRRKELDAFFLERFPKLNDRGPKDAAFCILELLNQLEVPLYEYAQFDVNDYDKFVLSAYDRYRVLTFIMRDIEKRGYLARGSFEVIAPGREQMSAGDRELSEALSIQPRREQSTQPLPPTVEEIEQMRQNSESSLPPVSRGELRERLRRMAPELADLLLGEIATSFRLQSRIAFRGQNVQNYQDLVFNKNLADVPLRLVVLSIDMQNASAFTLPVADFWLKEILNYENLKADKEDRESRPVINQEVINALIFHQKRDNAEQRMFAVAKSFFNAKLALYWDFDSVLNGRLRKGQLSSFNTSSVYATGDDLVAAVFVDARESEPQALLNLMSDLKFASTMTHSQNPEIPNIRVAAAFIDLPRDLLPNQVSQIVQNMQIKNEDNINEIIKRAEKLRQPEVLYLQQHVWQASLGQSQPIDAESAKFQQSFSP